MRFADRRTLRLCTSALALALLLPSAPASAYIGPGAGITLLGPLFSALAVFFVSVFGVIVWPLRRFWRRLRKGRASVEVSESTTPASPPEH